MKTQPGVVDSDFEDTCPVCGHTGWTYLMNPHELAYFACDTCGLVKLNSRLKENGFGRGYQACVVDEASIEEPTDTIVERAKSYWNCLAQSPGIDLEKSNILVLASDPKCILEAGSAQGFKNICLLTESIEDLAGKDGQGLDAAVAVLAVERMANPVAVLQVLHRVLKPGGVLLLVTPMSNSWPARFFREAWTELRAENLFFFNTQNIQSVLADCGFRGIMLRPDRPRYTLDHIYSRACLYPKTRLTRFIRGVLRFVGGGLKRKIRIHLPSSAFIITGRKVDLRPRKVLSIVMPVFNERNTFLECFNKVLSKRIEGFDKEIILVESNSTDGTRELVQQVCTQKGVKVIWQDRAKGKGNAVRAGLESVTGDVVMIQDADLEYDVNDYDGLVRPIVNHRAMFVLGSRHNGGWKMRQFNDETLGASFFNVGHVLFRGLLNSLYGQSLKDPFTMFKVFRADCVYGLEFECNRFDFDFEIVIKLVRKGYAPLEVPVNYRARSFKEGKKVSAVRDPWTWLWALFKYRFCRINGFSEMVRKSD